MLDLKCLGETMRGDVCDVLSIVEDAWTFVERGTLEDYLREGNVTLASESGKGGVYDLDARPYMRGIVRAWDIAKYQHVALVFGAQLGKTAFGAALTCFQQDREPTTLMWGFPDRPTGGRRSRNMLIPTIKASEVRKKLPGTRDDLVTFEYTFVKGKVLFGWAGSAASLSAETVRILIADEAAKWKQRDKSEGDPVLLFWRRGIDWGDLHRRVIITTPNFEYNHGWIEFLAGTQHRCFIPCPHCGDPDKVSDVGDPETERSVEELSDRLAEAGYQVLEWQCGPENEHGICGWGDERDPENVSKLAKYRCVHCGEYFTDGDTSRMMPHCKWIGMYPDRKWFSAQLPSWYSPSVTYGDVAERFYKAKLSSDLKELQDWTNSDKAEPFKETGTERKQEHILAHRRSYARGTIPFRPLAMVMTVDVQAGEVYYEVGAHGVNNAYAEVTHGKLNRRRVRLKDGLMSTGLEMLDPVRKRTFECLEDGQQYGVQATFIDANYDEEDVHRYARERANVFPVKGRDAQAVPVRYVYPDQKLKPEGGVVKDTAGLMEVQFSSVYFKNGWSNRLDVNIEDPGAWWLTEEPDGEYEKQLVGEIRVLIAARRGRSKYVWKPRWENHYLDCSYYQHMAAYVLDVQNLEFEDPVEGAAEIETADAFEGNNWATEI